MKLSKTLTTVTPLSKFLALSLFIILPLVTFSLGFYTGRSTIINGAQQAQSSLSQTQPSTPTITIQITPTSNIQDQGIYKIYTNTHYAYQVQFPSDLEATEEEAPFSVLFFVHKTDPAATGFPLFYVSVIPDGQNDNGSIYNRESKETIDTFYRAQSGEKVATHSNPADAAFFTFTKLPDISIDRQDAIVVENDKVWEGGGGLKDRRVFIKRNGNTYMIGSYYQTPSELNDFKNFLSSFVFVN